MKINLSKTGKQGTFQKGTPSGSKSSGRQRGNNNGPAGRSYYNGKDDVVSLEGWIRFPWLGEAEEKSWEENEQARKENYLAAINSSQDNSISLRIALRRPLPKSSPLWKGITVERPS